LPGEKFRKLRSLEEDIHQERRRGGGLGCNNPEFLVVRKKYNFGAYDPGKKKGYVGSAQNRILGGTSLRFVRRDKKHSGEEKK